MSIPSAVACPHCGGQIANDPQLAGQQVACPHCKRPLLMPAAPVLPRAQPIAEESPGAEAESFDFLQPSAPNSGSVSLADSLHSTGSRTSSPGLDHSSKRPPNQSLLLFGGIAVVGVVVIAVVAVLLLADTPDGAYRKIIQSGESGDFEYVWNRIDKKSQAKLEIWLEMLVGMAAAFSDDERKVNEAKAMKGKELFLRMARDNPRLKQLYVHRTVKSCNAQGDQATLVVVASEGNRTVEETVTMVKEDGTWKLSMEDSQPGQ